jgi:hypothetical protein
MKAHSGDLSDTHGNFSVGVTTTDDELGTTGASELELTPAGSPELELGTPSPEPEESPGSSPASPELEESNESTTSAFEELRP